MNGKLDFWVDGSRFKADTVVVNTAGVLSVTASSVVFSTVGEITRGGAGTCPASGTWSGNFIVEDPTVDGVIDGSI